MIFETIWLLRQIALLPKSHYINSLNNKNGNANGTGFSSTPIKSGYIYIYIKYYIYIYNTLYKDQPKLRINVIIRITSLDFKHNSKALNTQNAGLINFRGLITSMGKCF